MFKHVHVQSMWMKTSLLIFTEVNEQPRLFNAIIQIQSCRVPQEAASCNRPPAGSTKVSQSVFLINKTKSTQKHWQREKTPRIRNEVIRPNGVPLSHLHSVKSEGEKRFNCQSQKCVLPFTESDTYKCNVSFAPCMKVVRWASSAKLLRLRTTWLRHKNESPNCGWPYCTLPLPSPPTECITQRRHMP